MDSFCVAMKAKLQPMQTNRGLIHEGDGLWGEKIRGSLKNNSFRKQISKNLRSGNRGKDFKPGVAFSVLTRDINKELVIS